MRQSTRSWAKHAASLIAAYFVFLSAQATVGPDSGRELGSLASLQHAPEVLSLGDSVLRLKAHVWRDFMPIGVPDDPNEARAIVAEARGMRAVIQLIDDKGIPVPTTLHADTVWIIQGDQVWATNAIEERRGELNASSCEFAIAKGPQWAPASFVDVVISLTDQKGAAFLLAIRHQVINQTV